MSFGGGFVSAWVNSTERSHGVRGPLGTDCEDYAVVPNLPLPLVFFCLTRMDAQFDKLTRGYIWGAGRKGAAGVRSYEFFKEKFWVCRSVFRFQFY